MAIGGTIAGGKIEAILELKNRMSKKLRAATKDMDKFQTNMTRVGEKATRAGSAMTLAFTAPIALVGVASVKAFADFERQMDAVLAVTQASEIEFTQLGDLAKRMGETTVFTAVQAAEAMRAFGLAGFSTHEIMNALEPTLNLAAAGAMDMGTAADIAAKVTRGYGIEAEGTTHAMDVLTKAFTSANTDLVELGNAFKMVGPIAKTVGMSFEQTTASLQILANAGHIGSRAGRMLRRSLLRLVNPPGEAAKALKRLGVQTTNAEGRLRPFDELVAELTPHLRKTSEMAEIFGTIAMPGMVEILGKGAEELRKMTGELEEAGGTGERIAGVMLDNVAGAFVLLKSAVEGVFIAFGTTLEPALRSILAVFTNVARFMSGTVIPAFANLAPTFQVAAIGLAALVAALGPLLMMFGLMAPAIPTFIAGISAIAGAISFPVIAIGTLIGLFVAWAARMENVRRFVVALGSVLVSLVKVGIKALIIGFDLASKALFQYWDFLIGLLDTITGGLVKKGFNILIIGLEKAAKFFNKFTDSTNKGKKAVKGVEAPINTITDELDNLGEVLDADVNPALEDMEENWKKIASGWKVGAIPAAQDMMRALEEVGGISTLTVAEQKSLHKTLDDAILKYRAMGQVGPHEMLKVWEATRRAGESTFDLGRILEKLPEKVPTLFEVFPWFDPKNQPKLMELKFLEVITGPMLQPQFVSAGALLGSKLKNGFSNIVDGIPQTVIDAFKGGGGIVGALQAIGAESGAMLGKHLGETLGAKLGEMGAAMEGVGGKLLGGLGKMAGPIGAAIGALAGPMIGAIKKLFSGPTVAESVRKTAKRMFKNGISKGLSEAIQETRSQTSSDFGAMMMHMSSIIEEQGGVMAMGMQKAIRSVRDIFSAVERGGISTAQAAKTFGESFNLIAESLVASGQVASKQFVELITLAERFGTTAETLKFVGEQSKIAAEGLAALFGPTIGEADRLTEAIEKQREAIKGMNGDTKEGAIQIQAATIKLNQLLQEQDTFGKKSKGELEDLGIIAVASFESAVAAGMSFTDAVKAHGPAIDAVIKAQEALGITSDNIAVQELAKFQERVQANTTLVTAVEALDQTMLALSRTGSLNAETMAAMERQGLRMYEKLIKAGFSQQQAVLMMSPALKVIQEAHSRLGIPIDENTKKLIAQAKEAGSLEDKQKTGWALVETAVNRVVDKLQEMIDRLSGVRKGVLNIPTHIKVQVDVEEQIRRATGHFGGVFPGMAQGGIVTRPTAAVIGEAGPEAVIPLSRLDARDNMLAEEFRGLRTELRNLPLHLRDAILLAQ